MSGEENKPESQGEPVPEGAEGEQLNGSAEAIPITKVSREQELTNELLYLRAEFDNYRKRIERERQTLADAAAAGMLEELLPIVDDLARALKVDAGAEGADAYRRGVELIHRQLEEVLRKRGVRIPMLDP